MLVVTLKFTHSLFNHKTSILNQKRHPYSGILNRETSGDSKNAFLHRGDVLGQQQDSNRIATVSNGAATGQQHHADGNKQDHTSFINPSSQRRDTNRLASTLLMISTCHRDQQHKTFDISVVSARST